MIPELESRMKMDKMLERTVAACVNASEVPALLKRRAFSPDVILGLSYFHVQDRLYIQGDVEVCFSRQ